MENELSGGAKFGYLVLGFFLGLIGVLIAWLVNKSKDKNIENAAIKFSVIGLVISLVLSLIYYFTIGASMIQASATL